MSGIRAAGRQEAQMQLRQAGDGNHLGIGAGMMEL